MKVIPVRLAVMEQQLGVTISQDRQHLIGFLFANLMKYLMDAGHMNVTWSSIRDNIGSCDESRYFGAYQLLYDNQSDASLFMPSDANCDRLSPFEPSKVFIDSSSNISDLVFDCSAFLTVALIVLLMERVRRYLITLRAKVQVTPETNTTAESRN